MGPDIRRLLVVVQHLVSVLEQSSSAITKFARGLTNTFGVFQSYYQHKFPQQQPALISLIGSVQAFVLILFGFLAGPLWDAGYSKSLIFGGTCLTTLGYFMVSICDQYWQVMLAQGLLTGFGSCFLFVPAVAIIPQYFDRKRAIANGIAASGSGLGMSDFLFSPSIL